MEGLCMRPDGGSMLGSERSPTACWQPPVKCRVFAVAKHHEPSRHGQKLPFHYLSAALGTIGSWSPNKTIRCDSGVNSRNIAGLFCWCMNGRRHRSSQKSAADGSEHLCLLGTVDVSYSFLKKNKLLLFIFFFQNNITGEILLPLESREFCHGILWHQDFTQCCFWAPEPR